MILQNRYQIDAALGQGGMGAVYRAYDSRLQVWVAIKQLSRPNTVDLRQWAQMGEQFKQEATTLARLRHPNLVKVSDYFQEHGSSYLVMELVEGETLEAIVERDIVDERTLVGWAEQLLSALSYCHSQGVIHRDIKPGNIIIRGDGTPILVDFGLVKVWNSADAQTRSILLGMGTPAYAPPEQYSFHTGRTDGRSDIYSLGATLYHALTGIVPPSATERMAQPKQFSSLRQLNRNVSERTAAAIMRAVELSMDARFGSADAMREALQQATIAATTASRPTWLYPLLAIIALLLLGGGGWAVLGGSADEPTPTATMQIAVVPATATATTAPTAAPVDTITPIIIVQSPTPLPPTDVPTDTPVPPTVEPSVIPSDTPIPPTDTPTAFPTLAIDRNSQPSGTIIFTCFINRDDELCRLDAANPTATYTQLTYSAQTDWFASLTGQTIYFSSRQGGSWNLYQMGIDGSNRTRIGNGAMYAPELSPDGSQIVFAKEVGSEQHIVVRNMANGSERQLTFDGENNVDPTWTPDGAQIVFASDRDVEWEHFIINADGSGERKLSISVANQGGRSDISPDGAWLAFYAGIRGSREAYLWNFQTEELRQLTTRGDNVAPAFSPDGQWIVFLSYRDADGDGELFLMRPDGSDIRQITFNTYTDWQPRWGQ